MENPFEQILERLDRIENAIEKLKMSNQSVYLDVNMVTDEVLKYINLTKFGIYGLTNGMDYINLKI